MNIPQMMMNQPQTTNVLVTDENGIQRHVSNEELVQLMQENANQLSKLETEKQMMEFQLISKNSEITYYEKLIEKLKKEIKELKEE